MKRQDEKKRQDAEKTISAYLKPIFGFALRRCRSPQDAEDLSQEIVLKVYRALLLKDDIENESKFIWTIAHHTLSNYYRDTAKSMIGISIDEAAELAAEVPAEMEMDESAAVLQRLQSEIAYLSKLQRKIVIAYYYENRRQADIAKQLGVPLGTVKWHLFEAKKELKRGLYVMRKESELKFNPIHFHSYGVNGSLGTRSLDELLRSTLSQNICYCVRNSAKSINEIADALGVSPVYIEGEVEFLAEYGLLLARKNQYIVNFVISEPTAELLIQQNHMYRQAARIFANELFDILTESGILEHPDIVCAQTDGPLSITQDGRADRNFLLWALIPYIAACSGEQLMQEHITFEEVATLRPDGGQNIIHAAVLPDHLALPEDYVYMNNWCGPMWNEQDGRMLWQIDSQWSSREPAYERNISEEHKRILSYYALQEENGTLSKIDSAWLAERGVIKTCGDADGHYKTAWQIVILRNRGIQEKLLAMGEQIKVKYQDAFDQLKAPYTEAVLRSVPAHLRKLKEYELQFLFYSDGWFLLHCLTALLENGKLKEPTEEQRKAMSTLLIGR